MFVVQGRVLVDEAVRAGLHVKEVYLREGEPEPGGTRCVPFVLDARTFDSVSDTASPQGVMAVCTIPEAPPVTAGNGDWFIVADNVADPGNLGTIIRSAEASGATGVILTGQSVDVWSPKTVRSSAGALFHVPVHVLGDLAGVREIGLRVLGTTSHGSGESMYSAVFNGPLAVVLGNEAHGLPADAPVDAWVSIPHSGRSESLNVAMAASVIAMHVAHVRSNG